MRWLVVGLGLVTILGGLCWLYRRDRRRETARVRDVMRHELLADVEQERAAAHARQKKFQAALERARQSTTADDAKLDDR